jgi:hypothetical protein
MVLGATVEKIIAEIGHEHGTKPKELAAVLRNHGKRCADRRKTWSGRGALPDRALLAVSDKPGRQYHWVLLWDDAIHDPAHVTALVRLHYVMALHPIRAGKGFLRITSYMEIG